MAGNLLYILMIAIFGLLCFLNIRFIRNTCGVAACIRGIIRLFFSITMMLMCIWAFIYGNNLLWYGQHEENAHIEMQVNTAKVEKTSFIYLIEKFDSSATVEDVIAVMGDNFDVRDNGEYSMIYDTSRYTLNKKQSTYITFTFNRRKTEILQITWSYKSPSPGQFSATLKYLEANAFGKADSQSENMADWTGLHLEDTGYYLLLQREF